MPRSARSRKIAAEALSARSTSRGFACCDPTWNDRPWATRPSAWARSSTHPAISGAQPNLRDSGHCAPDPSQRIRQKTLEPAAAGRPCRPPPRNRPRRAAHAERIGARDVLLLLDGVAEADPVRRRAGGERLLDLGDRGRVEARAEIGEKAQVFQTPGSPSRRKTRACPAGLRRRPDRCRAPRRDRRRGAVQSSRLLDQELPDAVRHQRHPPNGAEIRAGQMREPPAMRPSAPRVGDAARRR